MRQIANPLTKFYSSSASISAFLGAMLWPYQKKGSNEYHNQLTNYMLTQRETDDRWQMTLLTLYVLYDGATKIVLMLIDFGDFGVLLTGDYIPIMGLPSVCRYVYASGGWFIIESIRQLIYRQKVFMPRLLNDILDGDTNYFCGIDVERKLLTRRVGICFRRNMNVFFLCVIGTELAFVASLYLYYRIFLNFVAEFKGIFGVLLSFFTLFNIANAWICLVVYLNVFGFVVSAFSSIVLVIKYKFVQIRRISDKHIAQNRLSVVRFALSRRRFVENFRLFSEGNRIYGKLFVVILLGSVPISLLMLYAVLHIVENVFQSLFISTFLINQIILCFALHFFLTQISVTILNSPRKLFGWFANARHGRFHPGTRLAMHNYIVSIFCVNKFSFTYDVYGNISLAAFTKFSMVFVKLYMITFKLFRD